MPQNLGNKKIAILVEDGFEQVELTEPRKALDDAGADTVLIAPKSGKVKGWQHTKWGDEFDVDAPLDQARPDEYDALLLPGGVMNPDKLRMNDKAVSFVKHFVDSGKPIAAICHGPWPLIEAGGVRDRTMTSWPSLKTDLKNAGASWVDREVVVDRGLVTSRKPDDIPAFNDKMIEEFAEGIYENARRPRSSAQISQIPQILSSSRSINGCNRCPKTINGYRFMRRNPALHEGEICAIREICVRTYLKPSRSSVGCPRTSIRTPALHDGQICAICEICVRT